MFALYFIIPLFHLICTSHLYENLIDDIGPCYEFENDSDE